MANSERETPPLVILLFGPFEVRLDGHPLPRLRSRKAQWLLALLAIRAGSELDRGWLAGTLWPNSSPSRGMALLRRELTDLRRALGAEVGRLRSPTPHSLVLDLKDAETDVAAFDAAIEQSSSPSLERAIALYRGPLLQECNEEWIVPERRSREQAFLAALETLAGEASARGDPAAERHLRRAVAVDPLRESVQRKLMQMLAARRDYAAATQVYRDLRRRMHREFNAEPDPETQALFQQLRAEAQERVKFPRIAPSLSRPPCVASSTSLPIDDLETADVFPALPPLASLPHNLPLQLTRFVGREREISDVKMLLSTHRFVTLTGVGGCGKTRLALQVAADLSDSFTDGVRLVELAPLSEPNLVLPTMAAALSVREEPGRPLLATLTDFMRNKHLLLLLDTFEHLLTTAPVLLDLLTAAPRLHLLVTSRAPLHLPGEQEFPVFPLELPPAFIRSVAEGEGWTAIGALPMGLGLDALSRYEAVELFLQRALDVQLEFALDHRNVPVVAEICRRLDGLPLAIELAAARVKLLSPTALLARLEHRLPLLIGGARDLPPRQQTLRRAIDWSHDLLDEPEQRLFRRLAVFVGGCTLEAVEAVCNADFDLGITVGEGVASLVDKSLLRPQASITSVPPPVLTAMGPAPLPAGDRPLPTVEHANRFQMLDTIREYGNELLTAGGEAKAIRRHHAAYFLALAEEAEPWLTGADQKDWCARLEREHDNLRTALDFYQADENGAEAALRLTAALWRFWYTRGSIAEARERLETILARPEAAARTVLRAEALTKAGLLASLHGDFGRATALCDESLTLSRDLGMKHYATLSLSTLGVVSQFQDQEAVARTFCEEAVALAREAGDKWPIALSLANLGVVRLMQGDRERAAPLFEECLNLFQEARDPFLTPLALNAVARVARHQGEDERAAALQRESLAAYQTLGNRWGIALCLEGLAEEAAAQGLPKRAARLFAAEAALRQSIRSPLWPAIQADHERTVAAVRATLDQEAFAAAWAEGESMPIEQAITYALSSQTE